MADIEFSRTDFVPIWDVGTPILHDLLNWPFISLGDFRPIQTLCIFSAIGSSVALACMSWCQVQMLMRRLHSVTFPLDGESYLGHNSI